MKKDQPENNINLSEKGRNQKGEVISLDRRLFMQLLVFTRCRDIDKAIEELEKAEISAALYEDINDPMGVGLLTWSEDPTDLTTKLRAFLRQHPFGTYTLRPEMTMLGRTYTIGYESDLQRILVDRPIERATDSELPWVVWYPLRRSGAFAKLDAKEHREILAEHGMIGNQYGSAGLATDIRLNCFGLNQEDNDFVVCLLGKELHPLSAIVQRMRKTRQTSEFISHLGPFFVGKVAWQKK